jgi:hypothetical protein
VKFPIPDLKSLVLCISALIFLALGGRYVFHTTIDLVNIYSGARCLINGCNPYDTTQLDEQYTQAGGKPDERLPWYREVPMYPPSAFLVVAPLTLLRFPAARVVWYLLNGGLFILSAGLVLSLCPRSHRWFATILVSLVLAASGTTLVLGNPAFFAISLLIIGSYFFLCGRYLPLGAVLLMLSLAVKPPIGGLIVLYLLARGIHRRYAAAAVAGTLALFLSAGLMLSLHPRSAGWPSTLRANISQAEEPGGVNDYRPSNKEGFYFINLQAATSVFFTDAREFNAAAWAIFLALLAVWVTALLRTSADPETHLLLIGSLAVLSLMPVYHRFYDARLLLISIPAVVIVYKRRRLLGALIGALTLLSVISIQSRMQTIYEQSVTWHNILQNKFLYVLLLRQQNLALPILFCLYMIAIFTMRFPSTPANGDYRTPSLEAAYTE